METNVTSSETIEVASEPKKENVTKNSHAKKHSKEEKSRKKEPKSVDQILRSLSHHDSPEAKLSAICKKYIDLLEDSRKNQQTIKQLEKHVTMIQREKDQIYAERNKAFLTRSNLESLCRELQKQNKSVKEESLLKIREEEEKRKEVSTKIQSTLAEITGLMNQKDEEIAKLLKDKMELTKKFNVIHEQMERFDRLHREIKMGMTEEKEALVKEKQQLLAKIAECRAQVQEYQVTEAKLRSKISMYDDKYDEFQTVISKSNEVFGGFNEEIEKMSKKILLLEKETTVWKQKWETAHSSLLEVTADKKIRDAEIAILNRKCSLLQELCRGFQQERVTLIAQLKEKNRADEIEEKSPISDKMAQLSSDCKNLEDDLEALNKLEKSNNDVEKSKKSVENVKKEVEKSMADENAECLKKEGKKNKKVKAEKNVEKIVEEKVDETKIELNVEAKVEETKVEETKVEEIKVEVENKVDENAEGTNVDEIQVKESVDEEQKIVQNDDEQKVEEVDEKSDGKENFDAKMKQLTISEIATKNNENSEKPDADDNVEKKEEK